MAASTTHITACPCLAAQARHGTKASVASPLSSFVPRRPATTIHGHSAARAAEATI